MPENLSKDRRVIMPTTNSAYGTGDENNLCVKIVTLISNLLKSNEIFPLAALVGAPLCKKPEEAKSLQL